MSRAGMLYFLLSKIGGHREQRTEGGDGSAPPAVVSGLQGEGGDLGKGRMLIGGHHMSG
jgi:hypothetical protein